MVFAFESVIAGEERDNVDNKLSVGGGLRNKGNGSKKEGSVKKTFAVPPCTSLRRKKKGECLRYKAAGWGWVSEEAVDVEKDGGKDCECVSGLDACVRETLKGRREEEDGEPAESDN